LEHLKSAVLDFFAGIRTLTFIPYARPGGISWEAYTQEVQSWFKKLSAGPSVAGIQDWDDPVTAVEEAEAVFIGGGNTFVLLKTLYEYGLIGVLREEVEAGMPYMGSSAGTNVAGLSIRTSNDMPIVFPPSFDSIGLVPFNLNPHYPAGEGKAAGHMGESRDDRIKEFIAFNDYPVLALREDQGLLVEEDQWEILGSSQARIFRPGGEIMDVRPGPLPGFMHRKNQ
jgi:dipeptidase E